MTLFQASTITALLVCSTLAAQDSRNILIAASRSGVVELINPSTLATVGRIHIDLPPESAGLNGVSASADGSMLYVEGPIPTDPRGCCSLYSIDLATLQVNVAGSVPGSRSRNAFVDSNGLTYLTTALTPNEIPSDIRKGRMHVSPDGRWLFGIKSSPVPALDLYDLVRGQVVRQLTPEELEGDWWPTGAWSGERFYLFATSAAGSGRLWTVLAETTALGPGVAITPFERLPQCPGRPTTAIVACGGNLFMYEMFGFKLDRRNTCAGRVTGGAWIVNPSTGQTRQIAPDLHFSALLTDHTGSELYGLSPGGPMWEFPAQLVRLDPIEGQILQSRYLDPGFWRVAIAPLRTVPSGDTDARILIPR